MKRFILLSAVSVIFSLQSCVVGHNILFYISTEEVIKINSDQSGRYSVQFDLDEMFRQMQEVLDHEPAQVVDAMKMDTVISFDNSYIQASSLTSEEKSMFRNGSLSINLDLREKKCLMVIRLIYKDRDQLNFDRAHVWSFIKNNIYFGTFLPVANKRPDWQGQRTFNYAVSDSSHERDTTSPSGLNSIQKAFAFRFSGNKIENTFDQQAWKDKFEPGKSLQDLQLDISLADRVFYKTTFILPSKIKTYSGGVEKISGDKKTITYKNSLKDLIGDPQKLEFSVEY